MKRAKPSEIFSRGRKRHITPHKRGDIELLLNEFCGSCHSRTLLYPKPFSNIALSLHISYTCPHEKVLELRENFDYGRNPEIAPWPLQSYELESEISESSKIHSPYR